MKLELVEHRPWPRRPRLWPHRQTRSIVCSTPVSSAEVSDCDPGPRACGVLGYGDRRRRSPVRSGPVRSGPERDLSERSPRLRRWTVSCRWPLKRPYARGRPSVEGRSDAPPGRARSQRQPDLQSRHLPSAPGRHPRGLRPRRERDVCSAVALLRRVNIADSDRARLARHADLIRRAR
jgi:hypothetical protein